MNLQDVWKEFKEFAVKGNAIDLAIGVIIGAAFSGIINSLVKDIVMPPVSLLTAASISPTSSSSCEQPKTDRPPSTRRPMR